MLTPLYDERRKQHHETIEIKVRFTGNIAVIFIALIV